jgi:hypothetical protein
MLTELYFFDDNNKNIKIPEMLALCEVPTIITNKLAKPVVIGEEPKNRRPTKPEFAAESGNLILGN